MVHDGSQNQKTHGKEVADRGALAGGGFPGGMGGGFPGGGFPGAGMGGGGHPGGGGGGGPGLYDGDSSVLQINEGTTSCTLLPAMTPFQL